MKAGILLVGGVGVNDAGYKVNDVISGKNIQCKFYAKWASMINRCYSESFLSKNKTYIGCTVDSQWLRFSNFKQWMSEQDWQGKHLDKDILIVGNKIYSPHTCAFVGRATNNFIEDSAASRGDWPVGVHWNTEKRKFQAYCGNPFTKNRERLGYFNCPTQAHLAWKKRKHELACQLADLQTDERVAEALRLRYA